MERNTFIKTAALGVLALAGMPMAFRWLLDGPAAIKNIEKDGVYLIGWAAEFKDLSDEINHIETQVMTNGEESSRMLRNHRWTSEAPNSIYIVSGMGYIKCKAGDKVSLEVFSKKEIAMRNLSFEMAPVQ